MQETFSIRNKSLDEKQVDYGVELYGQNHRLSFMSDGRQAVIPTGRGYLHNNDFLLTSHLYQDTQLSQQMDAIQKKASEELGFEVEFGAYCLAPTNKNSRRATSVWKPTSWKKWLKLCSQWPNSFAR